MKKKDSDVKAVSDVCSGECAPKMLMLKAAGKNQDVKRQLINALKLWRSLDIWRRG
jgi:hypothetical protein